jgi:hypothetical protein
MCREKYIFLANLKYAAGYAAWMLLAVTIIALLCWTPVFWGLVIVTVLVFNLQQYLKQKI